MIAEIIKVSEIRENKRLEGKFFLNPNAVNSRVLKKSKISLKNLSDYGKLFNPSIFKRQYCSHSSKSVDYRQSHDIVKLNKEANVFLSKDQSEKLNLIVKKDWILITGFGTILGYSGFVNKYLENSAFANNVCRFIPEDQTKKGYLLAFLKSKFGKSQINKNASGSAIRYIESAGIGKTLVPILDDSFEKKINVEMNEAEALRVSAYDSLEKAKSFIIKSIKNSKDEKIESGNVISIKNIRNQNQKRFNANNHLNKGVAFFNQLKANGNSFVNLEDLKTNVYRPGIFKRVKVKAQYGYPYIKGADLMSLNPFPDCQFLSKTRTPFLSETLLKEGQILITCAGNVGFPRLITKEFENKNAVGSQDIIRVESNDDVYDANFLFAYFSLDFVQDLINSKQYGSVIHRIEPFHINQLPIICLSKNIVEQISTLVKEYSKNLYNSFNKEENAIKLLEKEIEQWQK